MSNLWQRYSSLLVLVGVGLVALMLSIYIVPEGEQAALLRPGEPVGTVNTINGTKGAGLYLRIPFVDTVRRVDKRVLDLEMTDEEVLSQDQQRLLVNAYEGVRPALEPILNSVLRQELGRRTFQAMLTAERGSALAVVRTNLDRQARQYGAEVIDVQIKRTDLPDGAPLQSAFQRMETDREREARTIRAQGSRDARIIRAEADAEAARVYATAFGKDPEFYDFYRAMQSYDTTFAATDENGQPKSESNIILSPDNEYLRQFRGRR